MKYRFHNHFKRAYLKLPEKLKKSVDGKLISFSKDPFEISLNNHPLGTHSKLYG